MIQNLLILFTSENTVRFLAPQATLHTPPAPVTLARQGKDGSRQDHPGRLRFVAGVAGNAVGFAGLIAGCWMGLQVLQSFM